MPEIDNREEKLRLNYIICKALRNIDMDFAIDSREIATLEDYIRKKSDSSEPMQESGAIVIHGVRANGENIDFVIKEEKLEAIIDCSYKDGESPISLSKENQNKILRLVNNNLEGKADKTTFINACTPSTLEELQRYIAEENLIPKDEEELALRVNSWKGQKILDVSEEKEKSTESENKEDKEKEPETEISMPEEVRDKVAQICLENDLDISALKQVMEVYPQEAINLTANAGIRKDGGTVYLLRFKNKGLDLNATDKIFMVQEGQEITLPKSGDGENFRKTITDYMNSHEGRITESTKQNTYLISYTDIDGNTTTQEIHKEPRDLPETQKAELEKELDKLQKATDDVVNNQNLSQNEKEKLFTDINNSRIALFEKYNIYPNLIMEEVHTDQENLQDAASREQEQQGQQGQETKVTEPEEDKYDHFPEFHGERGFPRDPRLF